MASRLWSFGRNAGKPIVAVGLVALVFQVTGLKSALSTLAGLSWVWLVGKVGVYVASLGLQSLRWFVVLRAQGAPIAYGSVFRRNLGARFFTLLFPSQIGGDVYRAMGHRDLSVSRASTAGSVVIDRLIGLVGLFVLVALTGVLLLGPLADGDLQFVPIIGVGGLLVVAGLVAGRHRLGEAMGALRKRWPGSKLVERGSRLLNAALVIPTKKRDVAVAVSISIAIHGLSAFCRFAPWASRCLSSRPWASSHWLPLPPRSRSRQTGWESGRVCSWGFLPRSGCPLPRPRRSRCFPESRPSSSLRPARW